MGFLSGLGKVLGVAAPLIAAPFTGGMSLAALGKTLPGVIGAAGSAISGGSQAAASNRGTALDAQQEAERIRQTGARDYNSAVNNRYTNVESGKKRMFDELLAREKEGRDSGNDALKNLQRTEYIANAGGYQPGNGMKSFGFGPKASTDTEKQGALAYRDEMMKRLTGGNQMAMPQDAETFAPIERRPEFTNDPSLMKPGMMEKLGGIVGPALSTWELLNRQTNDNGDTE